MKTKKHPKANLENYSKLFAQLGLVLTLVIVYALIQRKTFDNELAVLKHSDFNMNDTSEAIFKFQIEPPKTEPAPKKVDFQVLKQIDNSEDDVPETFIDPIDTDSPVNISHIVDVEPPEDTHIEDVPFIALENAPVFPGCTGTKEEMKTCFTFQITKFVAKKFNGELASELGLRPGVQRIFVLFKIDSNGNIVDIQARAPHERLKQEAIRVVELLPQMEPGKQQGKPVNVKYSLPIAFMVE